MAAGDGRPQILIVPEQHSHSMERQLCAIGGSRVSLFAEVLSFTRLANRVFSVYGGLAAPALDGGGRLLLLCAALRSVAPELRVYQRPLPQARLSLRPAGHGGRAQDLPHHPGAALDRGGRRAAAGRGQAAGLSLSSTAPTRP